MGLFAVSDITVLVDCCCFHVSDPAAEEEGPSQAGSSVPAVELPRKRKGDVEERSDTHVQ